MSLSLRQRILWSSVAITLAVLLAVFLFVDSVVRTTIRDDQRETLVAGTRLVAELHASEVQEVADLTAGLSITPTLRAAVETGDAATIRQNLDRLVEQAEVSWLAVTSPEGSLLAATSGAPGDRIVAADRLLEEVRFYDTGDLWLRDGRLEQVNASTVLFGSTRLGVLFAGTPVGRARVSRLEAATRQQIAFIAAGRLVAGGHDLDAAGAEDLLREWSPGPVGGGAAESDDGVRVFRLSGDRFLGASIPLPDASGGTVARLVTYRSLDAAMRPATTLRLALLGIAVAGILIAFGASYVLARRVTQPVNRLLEETVRLGSGDLDRAIEPERDDEIGALARGFDQMRRSLDDARKELVRAERLSAVGRAASAIVHDFRQPVTVIQGYVELLNDVEDEAERRDDLAAIQGEVERLNGMMREVLDFARGGEGEAEKAPGSVRLLLDEVAAAARAAAERDIAIEVEHGYDGDWSLDFTKTRRALLNLVMNAVDVLESGGRIRIESRQAPDGLHLEVADDGPGIPAEIRDALFEPFVTRGKARGTGLGLAIAKAFTERQNGTIRFETSGEGTRFIMAFPEGGTT